MDASLLREHLEPISSVFGAPAVAYAAHCDGREEEMEGAVNCTVGQKWHWGSCAKALAVLTVAVLQARKKLTFQLTLGEVLAANDVAPPETYRSITLEMLMRHSSGVIEDLDEETLANLVKSDDSSRGKFVKLLFERDLLHRPGEKFGPYSNAGYTLLSYIVERHMKTPWEELVLTLVAEPLGMKSLGFGIPTGQEVVGHFEDGTAAPNVHDGVFQHAPLGVHSTLTDWLKFARVFRHGINAAPAEKLGLTLEQIEALLEPSQDPRLGRTVGFELPPGYAAGWRTSWVDDAENLSRHDPCFWHLGTNFTWQMAVLIRPGHFALVVASNSGSMAVRVGMREGLDQILDKLNPS